MPGMPEEELIRQAAQGRVLHNDDTTMKILERQGRRREAPRPAHLISSVAAGLALQELAFGLLAIA